jgi:hypothetical protein
VSVPPAPEDLPTAVVVPLGATSAPAPRVRTPIARFRWGHAAELVLWIAIAAPALHQIGLLIHAIAGRVGYPYDLEWMEGGMLHHALRIHDGQGIYGPPSVDFIPYLYTPLYPTLLALFGGPFGISYLLGRAISILGLVGIAGTTLASFARARQPDATAAAAGLVLALGLFAACYPYVEGWYDLVRADTFFLFMVTAGIAGLPLWAASGSGAAGHGKVAAGAALMALAFFCKQTGIFYVAFGGLLVVAVRWRRAPTYAAMAGLIGLGGCWILNHSTHGWFWTYVAEIHRAHDFNMDRFYASFRNILWHFPALTIVVAVTLVLVAVTRRRTGSLPPAARPFLLWACAFAVSTVVGAIGWGTEFAHFNAYMPAFLHGALAAGAAVPAVIACVRALGRDRRHAGTTGMACGLAAAAALAITCGLARWQPQQFIPTAADIAAGSRLIERLRSIDGDVWMPSHPWYLVLAGKTPHVHRMGVKDVTARQPRTVEGLDDRLRSHGFAAIVLDNRDLHLELPALRQAYRPAFLLPKDERPRLYTGASVVPDAIWIPSIPATPPASARVVFDFEAASWADGWIRSGSAWGPGPVTEAQPGQDLVLGATGMRFATSMNGGDAATGRVMSPMFALDGARLTLRVGGGTDAAKLRIELWVDDAIARTASVPRPGGDSLRSVTIELGALRGKLGKLVLVDDAPAGHLNVDDVWLWQ